MIRRIIAAVAALLLATLGGFLVISYANAADRRALADLETVDVLVASEALVRGTTIADASQHVRVEQVPAKFVVEGAVSRLSDLEGRVLSADVAAGEQLVLTRWATPEELRSRQEFSLPDEAASLHQVTINLSRTRALGGNIAPGDTVGVFVSLEPEGEDAPSMTHLTLHKVLVVRVEGGAVEPPLGQEGAAKDEGAGDGVQVTLALAAKDAETLVFAMEWGSVWLSYEPEDADERGTDVVVATIPDDVRDVFE